MGKMNKADLKAGMSVRNLRSGNVGEVRDPSAGSNYHVEVYREVTSGRKQGRTVKDFWDLENVEAVE